MFLSLLFYCYSAVFLGNKVQNLTDHCDLIPFLSSELVHLLKTLKKKKHPNLPLPYFQSVLSQHQILPLSASSDTEPTRGVICKVMSPVWRSEAWPCALSQSAPVSCGHSLLLCHWPISPLGCSEGFTGCPLVQTLAVVNKLHAPGGPLQVRQRGPGI